MTVAHLHTTSYELAPDGAMVDVKVLANARERLAIAVQLLCHIDLFECEARLADLDARSFEGGIHRMRVNVKVLGELEGMAAT